MSSISRLELARRAGIHFNTVAMMALDGRLPPALPRVPGEPYRWRDDQALAAAIGQLRLYPGHRWLRTERRRAVAA
jgi:hypothetical protein